MMSAHPASPRAARIRPGVSRRGVLGLVALAPAALVLPPFLRGGVAAIPEDPEALLRRALAGIRLPFPASLDLVGFSLDASDGPARMAAVVRMTWPPGTRQRRFVTEAGDAGQGIATLLDEIRARFSAAA